VPRPIFTLALGLLLVAQTVSPTAQEPGPVTVTLRLAGERHQFRPGEIIRIELTFDSRVPRRYAVDGATYDRSGRLTIDEFRLAPLSLVTDPMLDYFAHVGGYLGGGLRGIGRLGERPYTVGLQLNEWFRFDTEGTFTLSVRTRRVTDEQNRTPESQAIVPLESNAITFEILPPDPRWEEAEVERATEILSQRQPIERRNGCRILRFLGTIAAIDEMVRRYDEEECRFDFVAGLFSAPNRAYVVQQLEAGLQVTDQPVTGSYLRTLSALSVYLQQPELRPAQTAETKGRLETGGELSRRPELVQGELERYAQLLEAALPLKTGTARAVSTAEYAALVRTRPGPTAPSTAATARRQLIAAFADLPVSRQEPLLLFQWRSVADVALVPALRQLAAGSNSLADLALRRLYQIAPEEGRARIIDTIRRPHASSTLKTLGALPDATVPELDQAIAQNLETDAADLFLMTINTAMLHRYATTSLVPRVQWLVPLVGRLACLPQAHTLAYFLRVRPQEGAELLDRAITARVGTGCYQSVLLDTAQLRMTPELERRAITALDDEHPRVVLSAIDTLGRFGSPLAIPHLRARFEAWHRTWQGRARELQWNHAVDVDDPGVVNGTIETAYLRALGAPLGWRTSADEISTLREWCVTENCRRQADSLISQAADTTIEVSRFEGNADFEGRMAQYYLDSLAALGRKLSQFPKGTNFPVRASGDAETARTIIAELAAWATKQGFRVGP
jgi:hypothetical protein